MIKLEGFQEIMKFEQRVEERNVSTHSNRGGSWGPRLTRMSSGQTSSQYGPYGEEHLNRQIDPLTGQPTRTFKTNSIITYRS